MKVIDKQNFQVNKNERITVRIVKSVAPFSVAVGDITNTQWSPKPAAAVGQLSAEGGFNSPQDVGKTAIFTIIFNFVPGPEAGDGSQDFYTVTITGEDGTSSRLLVFSPASAAVTFNFEVIQ